MKNHIAFVLLILFAGCTKHEEPIDPSKGMKFWAIVNVNGIDVNKWVEASVNNINGYGMNFKSYDQQKGLYYKFSITHVPLNKNDTFILYPNNDDILPESAYSEICCESMPDQINKRYNIYEPDSLNNYVRLHLDSITQEASGMFKATYINQVSPFDLLHVQCDTFYCKYTKY